MVNSLTDAERLLEQVLNALNIPFARVAESQGRRTPDYELHPRRGVIFAEVKQIEFSPAERRARNNWREGEAMVTIGTPGDKVRKAITDAGGQLAETSEAGHPTLLVIYDTTYRLHGDAYNVLVGMYGLQTIVLNVTQPYDTPRVVGQRFGPKQKMTVETNTSISAIGVIRTPDQDSALLEVFHNWHARVPMAPDLLGSHGIAQFRLPGDPGQGFREWERTA